MSEFTKETKDAIQLQLAMGFMKSILQEMNVSYEMYKDIFVIHFHFDQLLTSKILLVANECKVNFNLRGNTNASIELSFYNYN